MNNQNTTSTLQAQQEPGTVYLVGAGPGDPELITLKAIRTIRNADVIFNDRLINPELLEYADERARKITVGKQAGKPSISQTDINKLLVEHALAGKTVVRLKGGDPFVFGRGGEECLELTRHGLHFEVVPGISSALSVPAYAGIPLTQRGEATGFSVISGHLDPASEPYNWDGLASVSTLVVLMGLRNISRIAENLITHGKPKTTPVAIIRWGTTQGQQVVTGTLDDIAEKASGFTSPATIVIGEVVQYHQAFNWFEPEQPEMGENFAKSYSAVI